MRPLLQTALIAILALSSSLASAAPFGEKSDINYAGKIWKAMQKADLVGDHALTSLPYTGQHPHGAILDTIDGKLKIGRNVGDIIIKKNYGGDGVSVSAVANDPGKFLEAITVMYRVDGFDADNHDWFWAKYLPDGSLDKNPKGMSLAGQVAKGADQGCIACHSSAPGGDMVFIHDKFKSKAGM